MTTTSNKIIIILAHFVIRKFSLFQASNHFLKLVRSSLDINGTNFSEISLYNESWMIAAVWWQILDCQNVGWTWFKQCCLVLLCSYNWVYSAMASHKTFSRICSLLPSKLGSPNVVHIVMFVCFLIKKFKKKAHWNILIDKYHSSLKNRAKKPVSFSFTVTAESKY